MNPPADFNPPSLSKVMNVRPSIVASLAPVAMLLACLLITLIIDGPDSILSLSPLFLCASGLLGLFITRATTARPWRLMWYGLVKSARQIQPAIPILLLIGTLSTTWMLSGTVPLMIDAGLQLLHPRFFLPAVCAVCALISVVTGSSWTTIATIGVAFMGIGTIMGFSAPWVAGAIISGAYFGDKISPLSDTTVLASSTVNVDLFKHIRYMMITTIPAIVIAEIVFLLVGINGTTDAGIISSEMPSALRSTFNLSPYLWCVPAITCVMIALRPNTLVILGVGTMTGFISMWVFQPQVVAMITEQGAIGAIPASLHALMSSTDFNTGMPALDELASTSGMLGMMPTVYLVLSAMIFGGVMIGSGMLKVITMAFISRLRRPGSLVSATVCSGLFLNTCTGDQYISLVIGGNVYKSAYHRAGYRPELLSRSLEDSVSVTSVLIPWNSCGMTQSTVLGVSTLAYAPCCIFNIISPLMSVLIAWVGTRLFRITLIPAGKMAVRG